MPYLGAHQSISGGLHRALDHIQKVGGEALQIFTRNQRQWKAAPLLETEITLFKKRREELGQIPIASHASYLINLGTAKEELAEKSIRSFADELIRCDQLGIKWVVIHPGSHGGQGTEAGLENVVRNLDLVFQQAGEKSQVQVLLETTAGQGTGLGSRFEELAWIMENSAFSSRIGVCVDSCHIFAAGYDLRSASAYDETFSEFERIIGTKRIEFFHLNDSKKDLAARVDRHEHIGKGSIGLEGFRSLLNDPRFQHHPMTLETPKGKELLEDIENLAVLRGLLE